VYPSLYEGFGVPPLEAMASGVPVVTTMTSSLPEVVGDAALMVNPHDTEQLAETMGKVLLDPTLQRTLRAKGAEQVRRFNWYRVARNTLAIYYEVYNQRQGQPKYLPFNVWRDLRALEDRRAPLTPLPL
jgi:glycosyltransferase involved in cell wall biosynthesis